MRVAYFSDSLPPIADGVSRTLCRLVDTLLEEGVDFQFFAAVRPGPRYPWAGRVHRVPSVPFPLYPTYRIGLPLPGALDRRVAEFGPDLVHVVSPTPLCIGALDVARRLGVPAVGSFHTDFVAYLPFYGFGGLELQAWRYLRWFYNRCAVTLAPSADTCARLRRFGIERVELWERGIDRAAFSPAYRSEALRRELGATDTPLLLYVGRLVREKNLLDLAVAANALAQQGTRFGLALVGDGPLAGELRRLLPNAHFAGFREGPELARWYASADLFVFPSTTETFGNVILEAFASGLAVVAADRGGARNLVQPGVNGVLARPGAPEDLAARVRDLLTRPGRLAELRSGALQTAARYQWPAVNRRLLECYRRQVEEKARAA